MFVRFRPARISDLPTCRDAIRDRLFYTDREADQMVALWRDLIDSDAANAAVMENLFAPSDNRFLWFCIAVFPTDQYAQELSVGIEPVVALSVLRRLQSSSLPSPLLTAEQIRIANSGDGLNYLVMNSGGPRDAAREVANRLVDFSIYHSQGYRLRRILAESYDPLQSAWFAAIGMKSCKAEPFDAGPSRAVPSLLGNTTELYGCSRAEATALQGSVVSCMMMYREPVIYFSGPEQHLLLHALSGDIDTELATLLDCSMATIRKRWLSIYDRIAEHPRTHQMLAAFLGAKVAIPDNGMFERETFRRGAEKKRVLLQYLRQHMEELRPAREPVSPWA